MDVSTRDIAAIVSTCVLFLPATGHADEPCTARIEVQIDPDVRNPRDPSFLTALTSDPQYMLRWVKGNEWRVVYDLFGPGTDDHCKDGVEKIRKSASVLELRVVNPEPESEE